MTRIPPIRHTLDYPRFGTRWIKAAIAILLLTLLPGCGIVFFPISLPLAISKNHDLHFHTRVLNEKIDPHATPFAEITSSVTVPNFHVAGLEAVLSLTDVWEFKSTTRLAGGYLNTSIWGATLHIHITAPGYYARTFEVDADGPAEILSYDRRSDNDWGDRIPIKLADLGSLSLERKENPQNLTVCELSMRENTRGELSSRTFDITGLKRPRVAEVTFRDNSPPRNCIYLTTERDSAGDFALDPQRGVPRSITVHSTFESGGFIRVPTDRSRPIGGRLRTAPQTGYQPEMTLTTDDFTQRVYVPFYFKAGALYGQGVINHFDRYRLPSSSANDNNLFLSLTLFLQPDGTRNIE